LLAYHQLALAAVNHGIALITGNAGTDEAFPFVEAEGAWDDCGKR